MQADLFWMPGPWQGQLAIVARPRGWDWLDDEASAWRQAGIDFVLSLLQDDEAAQLGLADEGQASENEGIAFLSFPIPDRGVPASREAAMSAIGRIATQLNAGKNVARRCRQSIGRAGLIATALLVNSGIKAGEAMQIVRSARGVPVPETREQRVWLEQLPSRIRVMNEMEPETGTIPDRA
jgi:protein-tyrosine phosphatase